MSPPHVLSTTVPRRSRSMIGSAKGRSTSSTTSKRATAPAPANRSRRCERRSTPQNAGRAASPKGDGPAATSTIGGLLGRMDLVQCSSKPTAGGAMGIRTPDLLHAMEARYQLRHSPARRSGVPATPRQCIGPYGQSCNRLSDQMSLAARSSLRTGSGRVPALCSTRRQPVWPSSRTDQQQLDRLPNRPHNSSGKPSQCSMPMRTAAP